MRFKGSLLLCCLLWLPACSGENPASQKAMAPESVEVETEVIRRETVKRSFEAVGTVKSKQSAILSSKIGGNVVAIYSREGDRVSKGQLLLEIDSREQDAELRGAKAGKDETQWAIKAAEASVESAKSRKDLSEATFKRYDALFARQSVTQQEFDEVSTKRKIANADLDRAKENLHALNAKKNLADARVSQAQTLLAYTKIGAPFAGVVTSKNIEVGSFASPGTPLMIVEQTGNYRLEVQVGETRLGGVSLGKPVAVVIDALAEKLTGKVVEIVPVADPSSRTSTIKIEIPKVTGLRSGLYGRASLPAGESAILLAPPQAIFEKGQLFGVYVVDKENTARLRLVQTGKRYGSKIEVLSGLDGGERVVVSGPEKLSDGRRVSIATKG
jgi:membrane fusion protein, multidrug efflux system